MRCNRDSFDRVQLCRLDLGTLDPKIQKIAHNARKWADDTVDTSSEWFACDLTGMCAIASAELF